MKAIIEKFSFRTLTVPYAEPIKHAYLGERTKHALLVLRVHTKDGCVGNSYVAIENDLQIHAVESIIRSLEPQVCGQDALRREFIYNRMWGLTVDLLHDGAVNLALAAIDIALWDICGKMANMPVWKMLGGARDKVPVYASQTLWRHMDVARIEKDGAELVEAGHKAMKLRLGGRPIQEDVERTRALRRVVGPDVTILTDALWGFQPSEALKLAERIAEFDIGWFEEPVREGNYEGLARVRERCPLPLAGGERISRLQDLPRMLPLVDHLILDVTHIGGITPWLQAAAIAGARNIPISAHVAHEFNIQLLAAIPMGQWIEYTPRREVIFRDLPKPVDGYIHMNDAPGLGLEFDEAALDHYASRSS
jgi:L-alanine-DL-glutamate epimerase-like enolase superfamily enzyme